ncbi:MAG: hypothetical protein ABIJ82_01015, partial [Patescibacteria group bacterium]
MQGIQDVKKLGLDAMELEFVRTVPTAFDIVTFDNVNNTNSYVDAGFGGTIASLSINGYTGTITQNGNLTITGDYSQTSGTFISNPTYTFSTGGSFSLPGGTFRRFTGSGTEALPYLIYDVYGVQAMKCGLT